MKRRLVGQTLLFVGFSLALLGAGEVSTIRVIAVVVLAGLYVWSMIDTWRAARRAKPSQ